MGTDLFAWNLFVPLPCYSWLLCNSRRVYFLDRQTEIPHAPPPPPPRTHMHAHTHTHARTQEWAGSLRNLVITDCEARKTIDSLLFFTSLICVVITSCSFPHRTMTYCTNVLGLWRTHALVLCPLCHNLRHWVMLLTQPPRAWKSPNTEGGLIKIARRMWFYFLT